MIVFCSAEGTVTKVLPSPVYQGSSLSGGLYFVAPFPSSNTVTVAFQLANGDFTTDYLLSPITENDNELQDVFDKLGKNYSVWEWQADNGFVTAYAGEVTAQFKVVYAKNGVAQLQTTASVVFTVQKGVEALPAAPPSDKQWNDLLALYTQLAAALKALGAPSVEPIAETVPLRDKNGNVKTNEPQADNDAANKKFVKDAIVQNIVQNAGASTDKVMSQKAVSDELNKKSNATNLENGSAEGALQQKDFIFRGMGEPGGRAYGAGTQSFGRAAKSYQCASFAAGNTVQSGMTEAEFNAYYWDSENNKPLHNGKGKDADGNILDATGYKYSESYAATATFGEDNKSIGRALFTAGQSNRNIGSCNSVGGKTNNVDGIVNIVHCESTDVTGDSNSVFANNSDIKANNVFASGNALTGNYDNQILLGSLNANAEKNLLEVGCGQPIFRKVSFKADFTRYDEIIIKPYYPSKPCTICISYVNIDNYLTSGKQIIALSGNQYFGTKTIDGYKYISVNNVFTSNPLVIKPKALSDIIDGTIWVACFALQDKSTSGNYQNFGVYVRHNGTDTYKTDILNSYVNSQKNAFEILWDGRGKIKTAPKDEEDIVRLKELKERTIEKLYMHRIGISDANASLVIYATASNKDNPYKNIWGVSSALRVNSIPRIGILSVAGHNVYTAYVTIVEGQYVLARTYDGENTEYTFRAESNVSNDFVEI